MSRTLFVAGIALIVGCGGVAIIDAGSGSGSGGSGAGGQQSGPGTGGAVTAVVGTGTVAATSGGGSALCPSTCDALGGCVEVGVAGCTMRCQGCTGACESEHNDLLSCVQMLFSGAMCDAPPACSGPVFDFMACKGIDSIGGGCGLGPDCGCDFSDNAGNNWVSNCAFTSGGVDCDCSLNGQVIGQCFAPQSPDACDPIAGCCGGVIAAAGCPNGI